MKLTVSVPVKSSLTLQTLAPPFSLAEAVPQLLSAGITLALFTLTQTSVLREMT